MREKVNFLFIFFANNIRGDEGEGDGPCLCAVLH